MFKRIEAKGYRCLKEVSQELRPFEILVGSNASGKSTFLDVVGFLSDFISQGLEPAVERRTSNFHDLVWGREGDSFELAVCATVPSNRRTRSTAFQVLRPGARLETAPELDAIHYTILVELDSTTDRLKVAHESVQLSSSVPDLTPELPTIDRWGNAVTLRDELSLGETRQQQHNHVTSLSSLPSDSRQPGTAWLRDQMKYEIRTVALDAKDLAAASPPGTRDTAKNTGSGLARQVDHLKGYDPSFRDWLAHVRTAFPDIQQIDSVLRKEDQHRYVMIEYKGGVRVPSWMLSEGTLRLLALTILAYLPDFRGVYLIEEPENGVHPTALETIYQSLSSIYDAQVLVATHSPVLLSMAKPEQILCFSKTPEGTKILRGDEHPALLDWQGEVSLGDLAASGILG